MTKRWSGWAAESVVQQDAAGEVTAGAGLVLTNAFYDAETGGAQVQTLDAMGTPAACTTDGTGVFDVWTADAVADLWLNRGTGLSRRKVLPFAQAAGGSPPAASDSVAGITEYADAAETADGTAADRTITALRLRERLDALYGARDQAGGFVGLDSAGRAKAASPIAVGPPVTELTTTEWVLARLAERTGVLDRKIVTDVPGWVKAGGASASPVGISPSIIPAFTKTLPAGAQRWHVRGIVQMRATPAGGVRFKFTGTGTGTGFRVVGYQAGVVSATTLQVVRYAMQRLGAGVGDRDQGTFSGAGTTTTDAPRTIEVDMEVWTTADYVGGLVEWTVRQDVSDESNITVLEGSYLDWTKPAPGIPSS